MLPEQAPGNRRVVYTTMGTAMKINRIQTPIGLPGLTVNALILAACSDRGDDLTGGISQASYAQRFFSDLRRSRRHC